MSRHEGHKPGGRSCWSRTGEGRRAALHAPRHQQAQPVDVARPCVAGQIDAVYAMARLILLDDEVAAEATVDVFRHVMAGRGVVPTRLHRRDLAVCLVERWSPTMSAPTGQARAAAGRTTSAQPILHLPAVRVVLALSMHGHMRAEEIGSATGLAAEDVVALRRRAVVQVSAQGSGWHRTA
jgi:hypothetical protein